MKKAVLGGVLGGVALFMWGSLSHMALPLGRAGVRLMPPGQETAVLETLKGALGERAIYIFPGLDMARATEEEQKAWQAKYDAGPAGIVVFNPHPAGRVPTMLGIELLANILAALMAAIVMLHVPGTLGFLRRAGLVALLGLLETFDIDLSQWNWYGFPTSYLLAQMVDHTIGWFVAGLVIARVGRD